MYLLSIVILSDYKTTSKVNLEAMDAEVDSEGIIVVVT